MRAQGIKRPDNEKSGLLTRLHSAFWLAEAAALMLDSTTCRACLADFWADSTALLPAVMADLMTARELTENMSQIGL